MDLALCLFKFFPYGGLQRDFLKVAQQAVKQGHRVTCYTMSWQGDIPEGLIVKLLPCQGLSNHAKNWHFAKKLMAELAKNNHDKVLGFNRLPGLDFYFAGDACFQDSMRRKHPFLSKFLPRYRVYLELEKMVFSSASKTHILLLDPKQQAVFQKYYHTQDARFHMVPPGIRRPESFLSKELARQQVSLDIPTNLSVHWLLMVGQDLKRKGLDRNLLALAHLPPSLREKTYLIVVGTNKLDHFIKMAKELGVSEQVRFLGARDNVYLLMQAADILLHPAYQETAGMVLVEAIANGLPVLVTDNCGYAFHIKNAQAGTVVKGQNFNQAGYDKSLADMLNQLPNTTWHQNALSYAEKQDLFNMPNKILTLVTGN